LEILRLPHRFLFCLLLVHTGFLPDCEGFPSHWRKVGAQFVPLQAR